VLSLRKDFESALKVDLILVEPALLAGVRQPPLNPEGRLVSTSRAVDILLQIFEQVNEAQLGCHTRCIIVECRPV
jgi:hypothetical protein